MQELIRKRAMSFLNGSTLKSTQRYIIHEHPLDSTEQLVKILRNHHGSSDNLQRLVSGKSLLVVIGGVVNQIVKNVVQPKQRRQVEVVHVLQGKWIGN